MPLMTLSALRAFTGALFAAGGGALVDRGRDFHLAYELPWPLLSSRSPWNDDWRTRSPWVQPWKSTSATSFGSIQTGARAPPFLRRHGAEWRFAQRHGFELAVKIARYLMREAGAGAAGISELATVVDAEHQPRRPNARRPSKARSRDDEFLPVRTFGLEPVMPTAGVISGVARFG